MGYSARLLRATAVTALMISALQLPALTEEAQEQRQLAPAQTKQADEPADVLLEVEGVLEEGDRSLEDGSLYDVYPIEGQAGQTLSIRLESSDFDTFLILVDAQGQKTAQNDNISTINTDSRLTVTLPVNGTYNIWANAFDETDKGHYRLSVTIATAADLRQAEADRLFQLGRDQYQAAQFREVLQSCEQAIAIYREIKDRAGEASVLFFIGGVAHILGDYSTALDNYQQSLDIARVISDSEIRAASLNNIGVINSSLGNYLTALNYLQQSLSVSRTIPDPETEAASLLNIGEINSLMSNYFAALDYYQQSLNVARTIPDFLTEAISLNNIGVVDRALGQYLLALEHHQQSLDIARTISDSETEAHNLINIGLINQALGNYSMALSYYQQGFDIAQEIQDSETEAISLSNIGLVNRLLGNYSTALDSFQKSLDIARTIQSPIIEARNLTGIGETNEDLGKYSLALDYYQQSLEIASILQDPTTKAINLGNLGSANRSLGNYSIALDYYQQALDTARTIEDPGMEASALTNLGGIYLLSKKAAAAEEVLAQSADVLDELRDTELADVDKVSFFEVHQNTFRLLQQALITQAKYEPALLASERGRSGAFAELLTQQLTPENSAISIETPDLAAVKALAQQNQTTLIEYSIIDFTDDDADPVLYIWVVAPDGSVTFRQQSLVGIDLSDLVFDSRQAIGVRGGDRAGAAPQLKPDVLAQLQAEQDEKLSQLHDILIDPIADLLPTDPNQPVVFIPQGELFLVPFPALKDDNGDYLIENHTILTAPSIQVLQLTHDIAAQSPRRLSGVEAENGSPRLRSENALVVGNPTMPTVTFLTKDDEFVDTQLLPLSGALREANAVSEFLNASALTGDRATEATVKQQLASADLIHLATHGLLEYGDPRETGTRDVPGAIALTPGSGEDGLLTSAEILQMDLQADLVVLSACDTGRGRITGDGVIGLSRSFIAAGVPSIIVSLWAVPDAPTAELMTEFYRQLDQGQTKAQALRQAMLITMQTHPDPKDWAAFTLIGESE